MSAISKFIQEYHNDKMGLHKLFYLLRWVNFILLCLIYLSQYYNIFSGSIIERLPLFSEYWQKIFVKDIEFYFICLVGIIIIQIFLRKNAINLSVSRHNSNIMAVYNVISDLFQMGILFFVMLKFINDILLYTHNTNIMNETNQKFYCFYLIYCIYLFAHSLYIKKCNYWYYADKRYLPYFDFEGNRIAADDRVIFYGTLYNLKCEKNEKSDLNEWVLSKEGDHYISDENVITLQDAVRDKDGTIKIYKYGMGEKWQ